MSTNLSTIAPAESNIAAAEVARLRVSSSIAYLSTATAFVLVLLVSSMYCLLAYVPTTYFAFIQAPFQAWMPAFAHWQAYLFALTFGALTIPVFVRFRSSIVRRLALEFLITGCVASVYLILVRPVQFLHNSSASFVWAIAFLLPIIHLGALECTISLPHCVHPQKEWSFSYTRVVMAAIFVALAYPGSTYFRYYISGGRKHPPESDVIAWLWAVLVHIFLFVFAFSVIAIAGRMARRAANPEKAGFLVNVFLWSAGAALFLNKVVLSSIPFSGMEATIYAVLFSLAVVAFTAGCVLYAHAVLPGLRRAQKHRKAYESAVFLLFLLAAVVTVPAWIGVMDWNSVLEKTWAVVYWVMVSSILVFKPGKPVSKGYAVPVLVVILSLVAFYVGKESQPKWTKILSDPGFDATTALEYHSALDASFSAANELLTITRARPCNEQCKFISQQTNIPASSPVDLHNVDLVQGFGPVPAKKPNIFIIVVDSLRQDYISAYNPTVSFTPAIGAFARESVVFRNAFTRYAGTTLSEPSIWSGMLQLHKHYVQPFHRVNGLEKLIQMDGYQSFVTVDTVLRVLLRPQPDMVELDRGVSDWTGVDLCSTTHEALEKFRTVPNTNPIFLYTQPQNIHIITLGKTQAFRPPRKDYSPFVSPYASELERLDTCFGNFIDSLKNRGLYDNSIVVLTSDHGEDLSKMGGERHAFSLKPSVIRIPLIIHVPENIKRTWYFDPDAVSFNTDITATLYELLGHGQVIARPEFGRPLFTHTRAEMDQYHRDSYMIASSYEALYGELYENGTKMFVENEAVDREEWFDLKRDPDAKQSALTEQRKKEGEEQLRSDIGGIAKLYGFRYSPPTLLDWLMR